MQALPVQMMHFPATQDLELEDVEPLDELTLEVTSLFASSAVNTWQLLSAQVTIEPTSMDLPSKVHTLLVQTTHLLLAQDSESPPETVMVANPASELPPSAMETDAE